MSMHEVRIDLLSTRAFYETLPSGEKKMLGVDLGTTW
jgi:hypothetical protein